MSTSVTFRFPSAEVMRAKLSENPGLNIEYFQEKGCTQAVADLAVQRFAGREKIEASITWGVRQIIYDLQQGVDGLSKKPLPKLKFDDEEMTGMLAISTEEALRACAEIVE
jgi:hypothetical protein